MAERYIVYGRTTCPFCVKALALLEKRDVSHIFIDLTKEKQTLKETKEYYNWKTVPIVVHVTPEGSKFIGGFNDLREKLS